MKQILHSVPPQLDQKQDLTVDFFEPVQWTASIQTRDGHADAAMLDSCRLIRICGNVGCVLAEKSDGAPHPPTPWRKNARFWGLKMSHFCLFFTILRSERPISTIFPPYIMPNGTHESIKKNFDTLPLKKIEITTGFIFGFCFQMSRKIKKNHLWSWFQLLKSW